MKSLKDKKIPREKLGEITFTKVGWHPFAQTPLCAYTPLRIVCWSLSANYSTDFVNQLRHLRRLSSQSSVNLVESYQNPGSHIGYWLKHVFGLSFLDLNDVELAYPYRATALQTDAIFRVFNDNWRLPHREIIAQAVGKNPNKLRVRHSFHNLARDRVYL